MRHGMLSVLQNHLPCQQEGSPRPRTLFTRGVLLALSMDEQALLIPSPSPRFFPPHLLIICVVTILTLPLSGTSSPT